jgi:hypothetical protein
MSMYTDLLRRALDSNSGDQEQTGGELLATLLQCRSQLLGGHSALTKPSASLTAVAAQLAYDAALVEFARHLGIESAPEAFDPPQVERTRLERAVGSHNVDLTRLDEENRSS